MKAIIKHKATGLGLGVNGLIPLYLYGPEPRDFKQNPELLYCSVGDQSAKNYISMDIVKRFIFAKCHLKGLLTSDFAGDGYHYNTEPSIEDKQVADSLIKFASYKRKKKK
jgi:hypothetical protein